LAKREPFSYRWYKPNIGDLCCDCFVGPTVAYRQEKMLVAVVMIEEVVVVVVVVVVMVV
jgi:hypothetical protein